MKLLWRFFWVAVIFGLSFAQSSGGNGGRRGGSSGSRGGGGSSDCTDTAAGFQLGNKVVDCSYMASYYGIDYICRQEPSYKTYCCETCTPVNLRNVPLTGEGFFVLDAKSMERYLKEENGNKQKAKKSLLADVNFFLHDVNLYYETLKQYGLDLQIRIAGIQVLDKEVVASSKVKNNGKVVKYNDMIYGFKDFLESKDADLSKDQYDFAMLLTGFDIEDPYAGYTWQAQMCNTNANGVVEMHGYMMTSSLIAHEIAHSFGAEHDPQNSVNVMSSTINIYATSTKRYEFSKQSADNILRYLELSNRASSCLLETSRSSTIPDVTPEKYEGKLKDVDTHCSRFVGTDSSPCTDSSKYKGGINSASVCVHTYCHSGSTCKSIWPLEGMPCAAGKSCRKGLCVDDPRPELVNVDENCIFGDDEKPSSRSSSSCACLIASQGSSKCYNDLKYTCCETCKPYVNGTADPVEPSGGSSGGSSSGSSSGSRYGGWRG